MTPRCLALPAALVLAARSLSAALTARVPVLPGWTAPVPCVLLALALAAVTALALLLALRMLPGRAAAAPGTGGMRVLAVRLNCPYCGNTGTVGGDWCPVCKPNGGGRS